MTREVVKSSQHQILRATSVIGSASAFSLIMSIARIKIAAIYIGVLGVGLMGGYNSLLTVVFTLMGLGVHGSAVREIALCNLEKNRERLALYVVALRRFSWIAGLIGFLSVMFLSTQLSLWIFGVGDYAQSIQILGFIVLLNVLNSFYTCLIQGMRRVTDLAKANIFGGISGTLLAGLIFFRMGVDGITWALIAAAASQMLITRSFAIKIPIFSTVQLWKDSIFSIYHLLKVGIPLMLSNFATSITLLWIIALITREADLRSAGLYSAAFVLTNFISGFVQSSIAADFYSRLTEASQNHSKMRAIINEQIEVVLLITVPALLACMVLAPWLINLVYSVEFTSSALLFQYLLMGVLGKVISTPLGFVFLSIGRGKTFFCFEFFLNIFHISLVYFALINYSLVYTGVAFSTAYTVYLLLLIFACYHFISYKLSKYVCVLILSSALALAITLLLVVSLDWLQGFVTGMLVLIVASAVSLFRMAKILEIKHPIAQIFSRRVSLHEEERERDP